jgi:hypothetical protein
MNNSVVTTENFLLLAANHYYSIHYSTSEFNSDLKRVSYVKRLLKRYIKTGELSERLILNHLILVFNVFVPIQVASGMLFLKLDEDCYSVLKTFLVYLNRMPEKIFINDKVIISTDISIDMHVASILRSI